MIFSFKIFKLHLREHVFHRLFTILTQNVVLIIFKTRIFVKLYSAILPIIVHVQNRNTLILNRTL